MDRMEAANRLDHAVHALNAIRCLCIEGADVQGRGMAHTDPDDFAFLLGLIIEKMRSAIAAL